MSYTFNGPAAGAEFSWMVELAGGLRVFHRHDVISAADFAGASPETKRNIEGLVARGILTVSEDGPEPAAPGAVATMTEDVPAAEPEKES